MYEVIYEVRSEIIEVKVMIKSLNVNGTTMVMVFV